MVKFFIIHVNYTASETWVDTTRIYSGYPSEDRAVFRFLDRMAGLEIPLNLCVIMDESRFTYTQAASGWVSANLVFYTHYVDNEGHLHLYYDPDKDWNLSLELEIVRQKLLDRIRESENV